MPILEECLYDFILESLWQTLSKNLFIIIKINVSILFCKWSHDDFSAYDNFSLNLCLYIAALKRDSSGIVFTSINCLLLYVIL